MATETGEFFNPRGEWVRMTAEFDESGSPMLITGCVKLDLEGNLLKVNYRYPEMVQDLHQQFTREKMRERRINWIADLVNPFSRKKLMIFPFSSKW